MVKNIAKHIGIFLLLGAIISADSIAQTNYSINPGKSKMIILGTSSLHNWQMKVTDMECSATLLIDGQSVLGIQNTWFSCNSTSIVSDYKLMNNKTYEALKTDKFPEINFKMSDGEIFSMTGYKFNGSVAGYLSIAGQIKKVDIPFQGKLYESGQVELEGKVNLKMSDFNIDPPSAFIGSLRTGDEITILYLLKLEKDISNIPISEHSLHMKRTSY